MHELVIVGAGISGMSLAHHCAQAGMKVLVLERDAQPGGCLHSERLADGFWFEMGAHTLYNSYAGVIEILEKHGAMGKLLPRAKVPFQLLVDGQVRSIVSQLSIPRLLAGVPRFFVAKKAGRTVREYYGSIVGEGNYERVFGSVFAAVPSQKADDFPAEMLFKKRSRRKDVLRSFTLQGGVQTVIDLVASDRNVALRTGAPVKAVSHAGGMFLLTLGDGTVVETRRLALAVPPSEAAALLRDAFPAVAEPLSRIKVRTVRTTGVAVPRGSTKLGPFAGLFPLDGRFFSVVSRDTVPDEHRRGFAFHFGPDVEAPARLARVQETLGVAAFDHIASREVVLPSPVLGHAETVTAVTRALAGQPLFITGNYFAGLSIEDCVQRSREEAARLRQQK